jgi:uncharacterized protein with ATP-grasp and redox domains
MNAINNVEIITGTSGAQYAPISFVPEQLPPPPAFVEVSSTTPAAPLTPQAIVAQISTLLTQLVTVITSQQAAQPPSSNEDFKDTVETILENATWFDKQVENKVEEHFEGFDIDSAVRSSLEDNIDDHIERYMNNSFDIEDHVNVAERVRDELNECLSDEVGDVLDDVLSDKLDEVLESKVGECLDEILEDKIAEILSRRTITINF